MLAWLDDLMFSKRVLRGREADFAQRRIEGLDDRVVEQVLSLICDAFLIPRRQRHCLRPDDTLMWLYLDGRRWRFCDHMEFELLYLGLGDAFGVELSESEVLRIKTVGDVVRVVGANAGRIKESANR
jgi:hypothetical protein